MVTEQEYGFLWGSGSYKERIKGGIKDDCNILFLHLMVKWVIWVVQLIKMN